MAGRSHTGPSLRLQASDQIDVLQIQPEPKSSGTEMFTPLEAAVIQRVCGTSVRGRVTTTLAWRWAPEDVFKVAEAKKSKKTKKIKVRRTWAAETPCGENTAAALHHWISRSHASKTPLHHARTWTESSSFRGTRRWNPNSLALVTSVIGFCKHTLWWRPLRVKPMVSTLHTTMKISPSVIYGPSDCCFISVPAMITSDDLAIISISLASSVCVLF